MNQGYELYRFLFETSTQFSQWLEFQSQPQPLELEVCFNLEITIQTRETHRRFLNRMVENFSGDLDFKDPGKSLRFLLQSSSKFSDSCICMLA
jgi:hypothetical protein